MHHSKAHENNGDVKDRETLFICHLNNRNLKKKLPVILSDSE